MATTKKLKLLTPLLSIIHKLSWMAFIFLALGGLYLALITFSEWISGKILQGYFYQWIFLSHVFVGLIITIPLLYFIVDHFRRGFRRVNRKAVNIGIYLALTIIVIVVTGILLIRFDGFTIEVTEVRQISYWLHLLIPLTTIFFYIQHRRKGREMKPKQVASRFKLAAVICISIVSFHFIESSWNQPEYYKPFPPSNVEVPRNQIIKVSDLMIDDYCAECHEDFNQRWEHSAHHFSSLKNPVYEFSIMNSRHAFLKRDGETTAANHCAGCHDPIPLLTGQFHSDEFNKNNPAARVGINCVACHSIENNGDGLGNGNYRFLAPQHYPFAFSEIESLKWLSNQLVKAKPNLHKQTFLKPAHKTAEFCSACHKVSLPYSVNKYRWLRGQDHYDEFLLSGFSGSSVSSFYYPEETEDNCNKCHLPYIDSDDLSAKDFADDGSKTIHDHLFPSANTALHLFEEMPQEILADREKELKDIVRIDIFGFLEGDNIDGRLIGPVEQGKIELDANKSYLAEVVVRTTKMGHMLTGGTVDSNEIWLAVELWMNDGEGEEFLARSGEINPVTGEIHGSSHFLNAYLLDRDGQKIEKRNVRDIFVALYNHQIPPGAADVVHYQLNLPKQNWQTIRLKTTLKYRKFSQQLIELSMPGELKRPIPVTEMASDEVIISNSNYNSTINNTNNVETTTSNPQPAIDNKPQVELWMRWNDYGIGLLRKPKNRQLKQAEYAFQKVNQLGRIDGLINLTRVYLKEGLMEKATISLNQAISLQKQNKTANPWTLLWLKGQIQRANGELLKSHKTLTKILETDFSSGKRKLDFRRDFRLLNLVAKTEIDLAIVNKRTDEKQFKQWIKKAKVTLEKVLKLDKENAQAYFHLAKISELEKDSKKSEQYRVLHNKYKVDEFSRSRAISIHRKLNKEANHAANPVVIYPLIYKQ